LCGAVHSKQNQDGGDQDFHGRDIFRM